MSNPVNRKHLPAGLRTIVRQLEIGGYLIFKGSRWHIVFADIPPDNTTGLRASRALAKKTMKSLTDAECIKEGGPTPNIQRGDPNFHTVTYVFAPPGELAAAFEQQLIDIKWQLANGNKLGYTGYNQYALTTNVPAIRFKITRKHVDTLVARKLAKEKGGYFVHTTPDLAELEEAERRKRRGSNRDIRLAKYRRWILRALEGATADNVRTKQLLNEAIESIIKDAGVLASLEDELTGASHEESV